MSLAIMFPGQGAQAPGLGRPWADHAAWSLVDEAEAATGLPLAHLLLDADADELADTRSSQLSVLLASLLAWRAAAPALSDEGIVAVAGHSLGQITALIATGVVTPADGFRLAVARADASQAAQQARPGGLVALLAADEAMAAAACAALPGRAWVANLNAPGQIVVGAERDDLDDLAAAATAAGVRRVRRLVVDGAFHTPLMGAAAEQLAPVLAATTFHPPTAPVVTNHDGAVVSGADGWPDRLTRHLVEPVRWADTVAALAGLGATTLVEVGPGTTLAALARRIDGDLAVRAMATPEDLPVGATR